MEHTNWVRTHDQIRELDISDAVREIIERRVVIEQTKGMLMFLYGVDADVAFEMLRNQSQQHNVKLHSIAEQVMKDLVELSKSSSPMNRINLDDVVHTAHQRITHVADRQLDGQSRTG